MGALGQDAVNAGLFGAGVGGGETIVGPGGHQPVGGDDRPSGVFPFRWARRKLPWGIQVSRASVPVFTKCDG